MDCNHKIKPLGAIFDQDGLLFDTEVVFERCWREEGEKTGIVITPEFTRKMSGCGRKELVEIIASNFPTVNAEEFVERVHCAAADAQLAMTPVVKPGAREILEFCRLNGIKIALASSSMRRCVDHNLAASQLTEYFDAVITGRDVQNGKPAPDIFLLAAEKIGLPPEKCVVFEDSFNGIRAAYAAGTFPIMIPDRAEPTPEILKLCTKFSSLLDALKYLKSQSPTILAG